LAKGEQIVPATLSHVDAAPYSSWEEAEGDVVFGLAVGSDGTRVLMLAGVV